jgi:glucose-1-phosphate cytidylyltransferase
VKVVILCGGQGTRMREETEFRPKPMVPIGGHPILWHIMKIYSNYGHNDFFLALGYKGEMIKDYFLGYDLMNSDFTIDLGTKDVTRHNSGHDETNWRVTLVDSGQTTMTGGRLKRLAPYLANEERFMMTYGDGVADVDLDALSRFHKESGYSVVATGVRPQARFGEMVVESDKVTRFAEKPEQIESWINGGFFVMTPRIFDVIDGDDTILEREPLQRLAEAGELGVYQHEAFWQCMDTQRDTLLLNEIWASGAAPWKRW